MGKSQPTLKQLEYFTEVCNVGNFRRAAENLDISQPTLTTQISALETSLDVTLFERSRRGTQVTPEALQLLPHAHRVLEEMRSFINVVEGYQEGPSGTYKLGVTPTIGPYYLPHILPSIHKRYKSLQLYIREGAPLDLKHDLLIGRYDCILTPLPVTTPDLSVYPLFDEPLKLVVSADHHLAAETTISDVQLRGQKVLSLEDHYHMHQQVEKLCDRLGARLAKDYEGTSLDTLRHMVVMGMGIAFLPSLYIDSEVHRPEELKVFDIPATDIARSIALVWRNTAPARAFYKELAQFMRQTIAENLTSTVTLCKQKPW